MLCGYIRDDEEKIIWFFFRRERDGEREKGRGERNFDFFLGKRERKIFWFFKGEKKERCCFVIKILGYKIVRINE